MKQLPIMAGVAGELGANQVVDGQVVARSVGDAASAEPATGPVQAFTFGDPEPVLDRAALLCEIETWHNGRWYEPPVSMNGLVKAFDIPGPHSSCIRLKVNLLAAHFQESRWLDTANFRQWAIDFLGTGNGYLERRDNLANRPLRLEASLARYTRRGVEDGRYFFIQDWRKEHEFQAGSIFHLRQEHIGQEIYGVPEFMGALQAGLLGEAATLFRRRYYLNGSHAGFIFYAAGSGLSNEDSDTIRTAMRKSKGPGNFRNLFIHSPAGKPDDIKIIPISEIAAKDDFLNIKTVSRDEMLAAHRTPPQLLGVVPNNAGGFGDVTRAADMFLRLEIVPLAMRFLELNRWLGVEAVRFPVLEALAKAPFPTSAPAA